MMTKEDKDMGWEYHQDARDEALTAGLFVIASIVVAGLVIALASLVA